MTQRLCANPFLSESSSPSPQKTPIQLMSLSYSPFHSTQYLPMVIGQVFIYNNPLIVDIALANSIPRTQKLTLKDEFWPTQNKAEPFHPALPQKMSIETETSNKTIDHLNGHFFSANDAETTRQPMECDQVTPKQTSLRSFSPSAKSPSLKIRHALQHHKYKRHLEQPSENESNGFSDMDGIEIRHISNKPSQSFPGYNIPKIKRAFEIYFYTEDWSAMPHSFSEKELALIKILLIKKIIHDNNRAKRYQKIVEMESSGLKDFMHSNPAINRKNVTKMNIFVKIWNRLRQMHKGQFWTKYFSEIKHHDLRLYKLADRGSISSHLSMTDKLYAACLKSTPFRSDFMDMLHSPGFFETQLRNSMDHFNALFTTWIDKVIGFVEKVPSVFFGQERMPELKFGLSKADMLIAPCLFEKLMPA